MIASALLNFRRCCALRLKGKSQVGILPICVSFRGRKCLVVLLFNNCLRLLVLVCTRPEHPVELLLE